jgi:Carboxypeptidase regulatory-like domain
MLFAMARSPRTSAQVATGSSSVQTIQGAPDSTPHTVRGTVVDSVTGEPISRALVQIGGQYAMLTDHDGHFEFNGVTVSGIPAWAMKPGYFSQDRFNRFVTAPADNSSSQSATEVTVKLVPEAIISGTVTGQDGNPIEGIPVQLKTLITQEGLARWRPRMQTRTNAEGQYRFPELESGKYIVTTGFHVEGLADSLAASGYIPARYPPPGGGSFTSETAMLLKPGDHDVADVSPEMEKLFPVTGNIASYGERAGVAFRAQTPSGEDFSPSARFTPRTGEFRIMLPGGSYRVTATAYMRQGPMEATREVTVPQAPVGGVSFTMEPYATIPVDIEVDSVNQPSNGSGQTGAIPTQDNFGGNISLTSANGEGFTPFLSARPLRRSSDEQSGPLAIENVSPGRYVLRAEPPSPWYVATASCGGVDLTHEELVVGGGSVGCSIHVVLRNDCGSVHARIRDSDQNSASGISRPLHVYAVPMGNLAQPVVNFNQQNGDYSADGLAPGRYLVLALDHRVDLPYRDPEAMRAYAELGQEISVTANGKADVEVALATGAP